MGGGASMDDGFGIEDSEYDRDLRYFCHSCRYVFSSSTRSGIDSCPDCNSSFVEEFGRSRPIDLSAANSSSAQLSDEQSRRLMNASIMLRLLEVQLRDELEHLQSIYNVNHVQHHANTVSPITSRMREKLRFPILDIDMLCSQPSCPICTDAFVVGMNCTQMPCSHLFHEHCVLPWLDAKKTCPICRYTITNEIISIEELKMFSREELLHKLKTVDPTHSIDEETDDNDLVSRLHKLISSARENEETLHEAIYGVS